MRTIYLKNIPQFPMSFPYYWKVVEKDEDITVTMTIKDDSITIEESEGFLEEVSFIKTKLCSDSECKEINRQEFDEYYKKIVSQINQLSSL